MVGERTPGLESTRQVEEDDGERGERDEREERVGLDLSAQVDLDLAFDLAERAQVALSHFRALGKLRKLHPRQLPTGEQQLPTVAPYHRPTPMASLHIPT